MLNIVLNKYFAAGLIAVLLVVFAVYLGGSPILLLEKGGGSDDNIRAQDEALNKVIQKLTKDGLPKDRSIIKASGRAGGGDGGAGGCASEEYLAGTSSYFVKARLERIETRWSDDGTPMISYIYAGVDEYEKTEGTTADINPDELLIVSVAGDDTIVEGNQTFDEPTFTYLYLKKEDWGYSTVC